MPLVTIDELEATIAHRAAANEADRRQAWRGLVAAVADGEAVDLDDASRTLDAAGKAVMELRAAAQLLLRRRQIAAVLNAPQPSDPYERKKHEESCVIARRALRETADVELLRAERRLASEEQACWKRVSWLDASTSAPRSDFEGKNLFDVRARLAQIEASLSELPEEKAAELRGRICELQVLEARRTELEAERAGLVARTHAIPAELAAVRQAMLEVW